MAEQVLDTGARVCYTGGMSSIEPNKKYGWWFPLHPEVVESWGDEALTIFYSIVSHAYRRILRKLNLTPASTNTTLEVRAPHIYAWPPEWGDPYPVVTMTITWREEP